jgi:hypothetical protein
MKPFTAEATAVAHLLNAYFAERVGWPQPFDAPANAAAADVQLGRIATLQRDSKRLRVDGILGAKTRAFLHGDLPAPTSTGLIINGRRHPTPFATVTFDAPTGLSFYGRGGWQPRDQEDGSAVDLLVLHWDECVSSTHCFAVLLQRGLSVHLMVDADGLVYQALDLAVARAYHARTHNERSVGIEVQNALLPADFAQPEGERGWVEETLPHTDSVWGHLDFTAAQHRTLEQLAPWLCAHMHIPAVLPRDAKGHVPTTLCTLPFSGVCGHYHLQTDKVDPGLSLWPGLHRALSPHVT